MMCMDHFENQFYFFFLSLLKAVLKEEDLLYKPT